MPMKCEQVMLMTLFSVYKTKGSVGSTTVGALKLDFYDHVLCLTVTIECISFDVLRVGSFAYGFLRKE